MYSAQSFPPLSRQGTLPVFAWIAFTRMKMIVKQDNLPCSELFHRWKVGGPVSSRPVQHVEYRKESSRAPITAVTVHMSPVVGTEVYKPPAKEILQGIRSRWTVI